jgi:hypothetical protein
MSIPYKFERSILSHDEHELILRSHHPEIYDAGLDELKALRQRLRDMRDRERTLAMGTHYSAGCLRSSARDIGPDHCGGALVSLGPCLIIFGGACDLAMARSSIRRLTVGGSERE